MRADELEAFVIEVLLDLRIGASYRLHREKRSHATKRAHVNEDEASKKPHFFCHQH